MGIEETKCLSIASISRVSTSLKVVDSEDTTYYVDFNRGSMICPYPIIVLRGEKLREYYSLDENHEVENILSVYDIKIKLED